ncbi:hypothetical protein [Hymenobacter tenuis]
MPTSSTPAVRRFRLSVVLAVLLGLLVAQGCRSTQSAYRFQPSAPVVAARPVPSGPVATAPASVTDSDKAAALFPRPQQQPKRRQLRQEARRALTQAPATVVALAKRSLQPSHHNTQALQRAAGPKRTTEVGLGTTVLGVLGLVVLPVSLIGLLIWGGPVWAVLAGLSAIAILVAYLDPFE